MFSWKEIFDNSKRYRFNREKFEQIIDAEFIQRVRKQSNLNQRVFASVLGVDLDTVNGWETGEIPCNGTASKLIYLIDQHPDLIQELYGYEEVGV